MSASEVRVEHLAKLGAALGPIFHDLWNDVAWLHVKWRQYRQLYGTSSENIALGNAVAPLFFKVVQDTLFEDTLLHLSRLTDKPKSIGRDNLVLMSIPPHIKDAGLRARVDALAAAASGKTAFARNWRNRRIAHRDLEHRLDAKKSPLAPATRASVEDALLAIRETMNAVAHHYLGSPAAFEHTWASGGGADRLVEFLRAHVQQSTA